MAISGVSSQCAGERSCCAWAVSSRESHTNETVETNQAMVIVVVRTQSLYAFEGGARVVEFDEAVEAPAREHMAITASTRN